MEGDSGTGNSLERLGVLGACEDGGFSGAMKTFSDRMSSDAGEGVMPLTVMSNHLIVRKVLLEYALSAAKG